MNCCRQICAVLLMACLFTTHPLFSSTLYVNANISGGAQNGSSWTNAYADLQTALNAARANAQVDEIWVAAATYFPTTTNNRSLSFELVSGVKVYGGFAGSEALLSERDPKAHPTILSGDIGLPNDPADNSYHVVSLNNLIDRDLLLDGFTITGGQADGSNLDAYGGGLFLNLQNTNDTTAIEIANCHFHNNEAAYGGAVAQYTLSADLLSRFRLCTFQSNSSTIRGGALYQFKGSGSGLEADYLSCTFYQNQSVRGGVLFVDGNEGKVVDPTLGWNAGFFNCLLYDNSANFGGAFYVQDIISTSHLLARNLTSYNNQGWNNSDVLLLNNGGSGELGNCIVLQSTDPFDDFNLLPDQFRAINCIVEGGFTGAGASDIMDMAPGLVDTTARDFRLEACSPAIDIGVNYGTPADFDPLENPRQYGTRVDLGAYEFVGTSISLPLAGGPSEALVADEAFMDIDGWTHYYNCSSDQLLLSIFTNGQNIGELGAGSFTVQINTTASYGNTATDLSSADYLTEAGDWLVMNRYWEVLNAANFVNPVKVRFYYADQDIADLEAGLTALGGTFDGLDDLRLFKVAGAPVLSEDVLMSGGTYAEYTHTDTSTLNTWTSGTFNGRKYAEFEVNSFSGGGAGVLNPVALPVELLTFKGERVGKTIELDWATASEENSDYFRLEKSTNAINFHPIYQQQAQGFSSQYQAYAFTDEQPVRGANYYRLQQVDLDGSVHYSGVIVVFVEQEEEGLYVFPNPSFGQLTLQLPVEVEGELTIQVYDGLRRIVWENQLQQAGGSLIPLNLNHLPGGLYVIKVRAFRYRSYQPIILQKD